MGDRTMKAAAGPALLVALALAGSCATSTAPSSGSEGITLVKEGQLTVCTQLDYPPFQARQGDEIVGFDVELVDQVAADLGVTQEITDTAFEGIESGESLEENRCDLAAAAMTITPERQERMDFSAPYFDVRQALLVRKGADITSLADLRGRRLGTHLATTGEEYAQANKDANGYEIVQFEDLPLQVTAVQTGQVDAAVNDNSVLYDFIKDNEDVEVAAEFDTGEKYGIGVRKGNTALVEKVNETLERIRGDGEYDRIYERWIGPRPS